MHMLGGALAQATQGTGRRCPAGDGGCVGGGEGAVDSALERRLD